ncbi:MAG: hypothetical protein HY684_03645 [Chloroflexi bacterium]|nr:hypothetical protein [Chloroflexota bacterium]
MTSPFALQSRAVEVANDYDAIFDYCYEQGWTDGLPIVPPTPERVERFVAASSRRPDEVIAEVPVARAEATIERIAVNAIMAGCRPEYMSTVIAAVEAMCEPQFNLDGVNPTTNPCTVALVINGPVRRLIDVNSGYNCLGPGWRANATIGRAVRLILLNVGGAKPGEGDKAAHGFPGKYTFCFGECEEESPWEPLHVERGFQRTDSTVTVMASNGTLNSVTAGFLRIKDRLLMGANAMSQMASNHCILGRGEPALLMGPEFAKLLAAEGMSKADVKQFLYDNSGFPTEKLPAERIRSERQLAVTRNGVIRPARRPEDIMVLVAGGPSPSHIVYIPTLGDSLSVTRRVRLPANA